MERAKVGTITVDSGTVIIADPYYLKDVKTPLEVWGQVASVTRYTDGGAGNVNLFNHGGEAVASMTAFGNRPNFQNSRKNGGKFAVFVEYREDGRPGKLIVDFEGDME